MKVIEIKGQRCVIQCYNKGDYVGLSPIQNNIPIQEAIGYTYVSISKEGKPGWHLNRFFTTGKENEAWRKFVESIDVNELEKEVRIILEKQ